MVSLFGATKDDEKPKITLDVDFGFIREMDACSEGYLGATESSLSTEPILERSRASLLGATMRSEITVHQHAGDLIKLEILDRET